jgi:hypothetical protein
VKRILVPVDFSVESLITLKKALDFLGDEQIHVVLLYGEHLPDSITELLFYSPGERLKKLIPPAFHEALTILRNRYEKQLTSLKIELFHGTSLNAMKNFVAGYNIDQVFIPAEYTLKPLKGGFNPLGIIRRLEIPVLKMEWTKMNVYVDPHNLTHLFN